MIDLTNPTEWQAGDEVWPFARLKNVELREALHRARWRVTTRPLRGYWSIDILTPCTEVAVRLPRAAGTFEDALDAAIGFALDATTTAEA